MSQVYYEPFYRYYGIRKGAHLTTPPLPALALMEVPRDSVFHYTSTSQLDVAPPSDEFLFRNITRPILMAHILQIGDTLGSPHKLSVNPVEMIRTYHQNGRNRRYKKFTGELESVKDEATMVVFNYGFINNLYKYPRSAYTEYFRWHNDMAATWKNIALLAPTSARNHFLRTGLPEILPSLSDMRLGEAGISQKVVHTFDSNEALFLLELWKWLGDDPKSSMISKVPPEHLDKVNIFFVESGRWFVLNLGKIASWRVATKGELAANPDANTKGIEPKQLQLRFLRMIMSLFEVRTVSGPDVLAAADKPAAGEDKGKDKLKPVTIGTPVMNRKTGKVEMRPTETDNGVINVVETDAPDDTGDDIKHDPAFDAKLQEDLNKLEFLSKEALAAKNDRALLIEEHELEHLNPEDGIKRICERLAESGAMSGAAYAHFTKIAETYKTIEAPDGSGTTLDKFIKIDPVVTKIAKSPEITDIKTVTDKTMLSSSLMEFDPKYIKDVFHKDVAGMVIGAQNAGIAITGYEVEDYEDVSGAYRDHIVKMQPVDGAASTFRFKLPILEKDGTYKAGNVLYKLRKQHADDPIRKLGPGRVSLTSYYGKLFVTRSEKKVNDYPSWLKNALMAKALDDADHTVLDVHPGNVFDGKFHCPRLYSTMAMNFRSLTIAGFVMNFDHTQREKLFGQENLRQYEKDGYIVVGTNPKGELMVVGKDSVLYSAADGTVSPMGTIEDLAHLEGSKAPVEFNTMDVFGRSMPIGFILGYELGLERLMRLLKVTPRRVNAGSRLNMLPTEWELTFSDETLIFNREDRYASSILAGLGEFHRGLRQYSVYEFDRRGVYLNVLDTGGQGVRFLREIDLMYQMFIDHITKELLIEMKEPTTFRGLLLKACEMLLADQHPDENDSAHMRLRGYERMAGAVYNAMVDGIRAHNGRPGKSKVAIDISPYDVWNRIAQDSSLSLVSQINPIQELKEQEATTSSGTGGRNSRSMTKHTRGFHRNSMGTISESTVDSSDVAINTYTSADPQLTSLRGKSKRYVVGETGGTALLSTSALLAVGADRDDPKRVNFIGIQNSHTVACQGYRQLPVRTGYEQVVAHRTGDLFATTAKKPGKVVDVSATGMVVEYDDGEKQGIELGRRFGSSAGMTIPHHVMSPWKAGEKFKPGNVLAYNTGFFEPDHLNPHQVTMKLGSLVKVALMESPETLEDSSAISPEVANLLKTSTTTIRMVKLNFEQSVRNMLKPGHQTDTEDILCTIEDPVTANSNLFDEESLDTLRLLSGHTPQAKAKGVIEHIEVFYHGDKEDMSETVLKLVNEADKNLAARRKSIGKKVYTGSVDESFRIEGEPLALDTLCIKFYITSEVSAGEGDKGVFANQMKTVFGKVVPAEMKTESGLIIGAKFGAKSIDDRIVNSPQLIGTTTTLCMLAGKRFAKAYRS